VHGGLAGGDQLLSDSNGNWQIRKAISIIKKRSGAHEGAVRELVMSKGGVRVGPPLDEFQGVLTGVPSYLGGQRGGALR